MTTLELKNKVIGKINQINDDEVLAEVYRLLENNDDDFKIYSLSENHKLAVEEAQAQIKRGESLNNDSANKDIDEWLNK